MQFAINWSYEAQALVNAGTITVDIFKCPDWEDIVSHAQSAGRCYVHFPLQIGTGQRAEWDFHTIEAWLTRTGTRYVNCHIVPNNQCFPDDITPEAMLPVLIDEVQTLVQTFGAEHVIIENFPISERALAAGYLPQGADPILFEDIINATGCGFLLDISHAVMSSQYRQQSFEDYVAALPVTHIRELHVTGLGERLTGGYGDHMPMTADDWQRLDYCLEQVRCGAWGTPDLMAFEYGGVGRLKENCGSDPAVIAEQVPHLYQRAHRVPSRH